MIGGWPVFPPTGTSGLTTTWVPTSGTTTTGSGIVHYPYTPAVSVSSTPPHAHNLGKVFLLDEDPDAMVVVSDMQGHYLYINDKTGVCSTATQVTIDAIHGKKEVASLRGSVAMWHKFKDAK